jgi:hypothetical protein
VLLRGAGDVRLELELVVVGLLELLVVELVLLLAEFVRELVLVLVELLLLRVEGPNL